MGDYMSCNILFEAQIHPDSTAPFGDSVGLRGSHPSFLPLVPGMYILVSSQALALKQRPHQIYGGF